MAFRAGPLVSVRWLQKRIVARPKQLAVLDASMTLRANCHKEYLTKHIPGALYYDLRTCINPLPTTARNIPDQVCYQEQIRSLGINEDSHVVMYDAGAMYHAAYAWWLMRAYGHESVSVLDGGLHQWEAHGFHVDCGEEEAPKRGDFTVSVNSNLITNMDAMEQQISSGKQQIIDVRKATNFQGIDPEPAIPTAEALKGMNLPLPEGMKRGHMPGAVNIPMLTLQNEETKCLHKPNKLEEIFMNHGVDLDRPTTAVCYNGLTATLLILAAKVLEKPDITNYYGAWTEWGQLAKPELIKKDGESRKSG